MKLKEYGKAISECELKAQMLLERAELVGEGGRWSRLGTLL